MVNIDLAVFDRVFLSNPSSKSTFAQNKSCRSYRPLQLLFWPNFMFQCKIWSFGWSKSAKSHSISVNWDSPVLLSSTPANDVGVATRRTSANLAHRALVPVLIPSPRAVTVFPSLSPLSHSTEPSNPSPAARRRKSCAGRPPPSRRHFLAPRPPSTFLALPSTHAVRSRARSSQSRPESVPAPRPPLLLHAEALPRHRAPPSDLPPLKLSRR